MKCYKPGDTDKNNFLQIVVETGRWLSKHLAACHMANNYMENRSDNAFWMLVAIWEEGNWKLNWPIPSKWQSNVTRPINLMCHRRYGRTIWSLAYAATAVNFDWGSWSHPGMGRGLWLVEDIRDKGYVKPDWMNTYSFHLDPNFSMDWEGIQEHYRKALVTGKKIWGVRSMSRHLIKDMEQELARQNVPDEEARAFACCFYNHEGKVKRNVLCW